MVRKRERHERPAERAFADRTYEEHLAWARWHQRQVTLHALAAKRNQLRAKRLALGATTPQGERGEA